MLTSHILCQLFHQNLSKCFTHAAPPLHIGNLRHRAHNILDQPLIVLPINRISTLLFSAVLTDADFMMILALANNVKLKDGYLLFPNDRSLATAGAIRDMNGDIRFSDGSVLSLSGHLQFSDGYSLNIYDSGLLHQINSTANCAAFQCLLLGAWIIIPWSFRKFTTCNGVSQCQGECSMVSNNQQTPPFLNPPGVHRIRFGREGCKPRNRWWKQSKKGYEPGGWCSDRGGGQCTHMLSEPFRMQKYPFGKSVLNWWYHSSSKIASKPLHLLSFAWKFSHFPLHFLFQIIHISLDFWSVRGSQNKEIPCQTLLGQTLLFFPGLKPVFWTPSSHPNRCSKHSFRYNVWRETKSDFVLELLSLFY